MGRTLKRVALDFSWPLNKRWDGYLNPYYKLRAECSLCEGTGYSPGAKLFKDQWYGYAEFDPVAYGAKPLTLDHPNVQAFARRNCGSSEVAVAREAFRLWDMWRHQWSKHLIQADVDALVKADRLWGFTRVPRNAEQKANCHENGWTKEWNGYTPTADEVNSWSIVSFGHDLSNSWICIKARCAREGLDLECSACSGKGDLWPPGAEELAEQWEETPPPEGPGYQLWETTSEGSPISPVFETLDELCSYAAEHCSTFGSFKVTALQWREMLDDGFVAHREGNMIFM